ncbi:hypothetical protein DD582_30755, partial [Klebsiella pneumoniae]
TQILDREPQNKTALASLMATLTRNRIDSPALGLKPALIYCETLSYPTPHDIVVMITICCGKKGCQGLI